MTTGGYAARRERALAALGAAARLVSAGAVPRQLFADLEHHAEAFELGVAVSFERAPRRQPSVLFYFNPRNRAEAFRQLALAALRRVGLDVSLAEAAFERVPAARASTVLGLSWSDGQRQPVATLYLEEVERFWPGAQATAMSAELGTLAGAAPPLGEDRRVGSLYIWAFDFGAAGPPAFKIYRSADCSTRPLVRQELLEHLDGSPPSADVDALLFEDGEPPPSYILQRRYDLHGSPTIHKVYRCFPGYEEGDPEPSSQRVERALALLAPAEREGPLGALLLGRGPDGERSFRPTSIGLAFSAGRGQPAYTTGYWCLLRGPQRS